MEIISRSVSRRFQIIVGAVLPDLPPLVSTPECDDLINTVTTCSKVDMLAFLGLHE